MPPAHQLRSRFERRLRRAPIPALSDVVTKQPSAGRNLDALDGIRGLAVLIVVASHTGGFHLKWQGGVGDRPLGLRYKHAYGVLSGALIYVTMVCEGRLTHRIMSSLALRAMGVVSFSLYLFHVVVLYTIGIDFFGLPLGNALFFTTLGATYVVACVVYSLVERPFMRVRSR